MTAALPLGLPLLALHPRLRGGLASRLGRLPVTPADAQPPIWFHGSSAGDVAALLPLRRMLAEWGSSGVVSAWTRSGSLLAQQRLGGEDGSFVAPLDHPWIIRRALRRLRPRALVLECLEMWPCTIAECLRRNVPVMVVNGRMSARSLRWYTRFACLFRPCFEGLELVSALTEEDAERFRAAGAPDRHIIVSSSSKHAGPVPGRPDSVPRRDPKVVFGSIHREEERLVLPLLGRLLRRTPELELVLAPRYVHRAPRVREKLARLGIAAELGPAEPGAPGRVTVLSTVGSLAAAYEGARAAFVGGSLTPRGCHNVMEPAGHGVPVLTGPHIAHVSEEMGALQRAGAATVVRDGDELAATVLRLLRDERRFRDESLAALAVAQGFASAAEGIGRRIDDLLRRRGAGGRT